MGRLAFITTLVVVALAAVVPAEANWVREAVNSVVRDTKRRCCWPQPFTRADAYTVQATLGLMVSNGWRRQNMLCDFHFVPETDELTEAGRQKVYWILTEGPQQHRVIYVHRVGSFEKTAARINHVQQAAAAMVPEGPPPPVLATYSAPPGWPAAEVDIVGRKFIDSTPTPRVPKQEATQSE
jgi:hypothetical protein